MLSPFLGMDFYLEQPIFWSEFHSRLIVAIADAVVNAVFGGNCCKIVNIKTLVRLNPTDFEHFDGDGCEGGAVKV